MEILSQMEKIDNQHHQSQHRAVCAVIEVDTGCVGTQRTVITHPIEAWRWGGGGVLREVGKEGFLKVVIPGRFWKSKWQVKQKHPFFGRESSKLRANPNQG